MAVGGSAAASQPVLAQTVRSHWLRSRVGCREDEAVEKEGWATAMADWAVVAEAKTLSMLREEEG